MLDDLDLASHPTLLIFNKTDLLEHEELLALQERVARLTSGALFVSTMTEDGIEPLRRALALAVRARRPLSEIRFPAADGKLLAEVHRGGEVIDQRVDGEALVLTARVDDALASRLRRAGAMVAQGLEPRTSGM